MNSKETQSAVRPSLIQATAVKPSLNSSDKQHKLTPVLQLQGNIRRTLQWTPWCRTRLSPPSPSSGLLLTATALCLSRATSWTGGRLAPRHGRDATLERPLRQQKLASPTSPRRPPTNSAFVPSMLLARVLTWTCQEASTWVRLITR